MSNILLHAREAGIATTFQHALSSFNAKGHRVFIDANAVAGSILQERAFQEKDAQNIDIAFCGFDNILLDETGKFITWMDQLNIPVIGVLDTWKGIDRFWHNNGKQRQLPLFLGVPDQLSKSYLLEKKLRNTEISICGFPYFDFLIESSKKGILSKKREALRKKLGITQERRILVLFSEVFANGQSLLQEKTKSSDSVQDWIIEKFSLEYDIFIRTHPSENISITNGARVINDLTLLESIAISDKVVGLSSTAFFYAQNLGKKSYLIAPELADWDSSKSLIPSLLWQDLVKEQGKLMLSTEKTKYWFEEQLNLINQGVKNG